MKKQFLLLFTSLFITDIYAQTNIYHALPDSGYYWNVINLGTECETGSADTIQGYFLYTTIQGDTLVGAKRYKKVYATNNLKEIVYFMGYFYEDTLNRKVYVVTDNPDDHTITEESLLYDFNIGIGETVDDYFDFWTFDEDHPANSNVISVDSIEIESVYRRRIGIQYELFQCDNKKEIKIDTTYWIEGIGNTAGFTLPFLIPMNAGEYAVDVLACVSNGAEVVFINPHEWHNCDSVFLKFIPIIDLNSEEIVTVYPQPADQLLNIELNLGSREGNFTIQILDLSGKLVYRQVYFTADINIPVNNIQTGIYLIKIQYETGVYFSRKIIIQH